MVWNPAAPSDNESFGPTPSLLRENWSALDDTISVDHYEMNETLEGQHRQITLPEITTPSNIADTGIIYTKEVNEITEPFYMDSDGNETQLVSEGTIGGDKSFEILGIKDGVDGAINGASGKDLYLIMGDNAGVNKVSIMGSSETITAATQGNPCQITAVAHGLETGDEIRIIDVAGMFELNNANYTITYVDDDNFTLDGVNASGFTAYTSGGRFCKEAIAFSTDPVISMAIVSSGGALTASSGNILSTSAIGVGLYKINFIKPYASVNDYVVTGNAVSNPTRVRNLTIHSKDVAFVNIGIADDNSNAINASFDVVINNI